ncbi:glycosyltransferase [Ningiella sp. W23]|uniref:glycosyltransferase n=1 Tax=Ningiella sp. W23 TaxID=3023715 RepID=UPI0037563ED7
MTKTIFLSVGTQFPFPRLINCVRTFVENNDDYHCMAQTLQELVTTQRFTNFSTLDESKMLELASMSDVIVGHLGIGTVLLAKKLNKPAVVLARKFEQGEHRSEHQEKSVEYLSPIEGVYIAENEKHCRSLLNSVDNLSAAQWNTAELLSFANNLKDHINSLELET